MNSKRSLMTDETSIFDQIRTLLSSARLLEQESASGEGIVVGVIDSGVDRPLLEAKYRARGLDIHTIEGAIFRSDHPEPLPYKGQQSAPHGTTVADIILTLAPRVKLFSADVFGTQGGCEVENVIRAMHYCVDVWQCKIVNLSLGVPEHRLQQLAKRLQLLRAVEEAYSKDVLVFAAAHNEHPLTRSYPAVFSPPLFSVDKGLFDNPLDFAYRPHESIEFQAHARGYVGPFAREPATSWATPHLAGIAARLLSLKPDLKPFELKTLLYWIFQAKDQSMTQVKVSEQT